MKTSIIKWDESMVERCLARCQDTAVKTKEDSFKPAQRTANDVQWDEFEKALNKALKR